MVAKVNPAGMGPFVTLARLKIAPSSTSLTARSYAVAVPVLVITSVMVISSPASTPLVGDTVLKIAMSGSTAVTGGPSISAGGFGLPVKVTVALLVSTVCGSRPELAGRFIITACKVTRRTLLSCP